MVFSSTHFDEHERVLFWADRDSGLRAIVAVHRVRGGRAVGGCRVRAYGSDEEALTDVLRLSRGMTCKTALAGLPYGGAKAVVIGAPAEAKSEAAMRAFGRCVASLDGVYVTAEDVGMTQADLAVMKQETPWVLGADDTGGEAAPFTALGVLHALRGGLLHRTGSDDLSGLTVAVQGVGSVGSRLCDLLHEAGARLVVADVSPEAVAAVVARTGADVAESDAIHAVPADVFAPCALGAGLNRRTIPELAAGVVAGAANNQLETAEDGDRLAARGIDYVPDFLSSAGGVVNGVQELDGYDRDAVLRKIGGFAETARLVLEQAAARGVSSAEAAEQIALERIAG